MKLIATKSYSYNTRRLKAGDEFDTTNDMHARILVGARKAKYAAEHGKPAAAQPVARVAEPEPKREPEDNGAKALDGLRSQAERLGIVVDGRWGVARLQHEIMQARRR
jgi:hypothetical protein